MLLYAHIPAVAILQPALRGTFYGVRRAGTGGYGQVRDRHSSSFISTTNAQADTTECYVVLLLLLPLLLAHGCDTEVSGFITTMGRMRCSAPRLGTYFPGRSLDVDDWGVTPYFAGKPASAPYQKPGFSPCTEHIDINLLRSKVRSGKIVRSTT